MNSARPRNLKDLVRMARRHWMPLILPAVVITVACCLALWLMPNEFVSTAAILDDQSKASPDGNRSTDLQLNLVRRQAADRAAITALIDSHDLFRRQRDKGTDQEVIVSEVRTRIGIDLVAVRDEGPVMRVS